MKECARGEWRTGEANPEDEEFGDKKEAPEPRCLRGKSRDLLASLLLTNQTPSRSNHGRLPFRQQSAEVTAKTMTRYPIKVLCSMNSSRAMYGCHTVTGPSQLDSLPEACRKLAAAPVFSIGVPTHQSVSDSTLPWDQVLHGTGVSSKVIRPPPRHPASFAKPCTKPRFRVPGKGVAPDARLPGDWDVPSEFCVSLNLPEAMVAKSVCEIDPCSYCPRKD